MRKLVYLILLASVVLLNACSDSGSDSPSDSNAHPDGWFSSHAAAAIAIADGSPASLREDPVATFAHVVDMLVTPTPAFASLAYEDCTTCHGPDLRGSGDAVSCYSCHSYNPAPPFSTHPSTWTDPYTNHGSYVTANTSDSCQECHGQDLRGYQTAPSCYSDSFDGRGCHAGGPGAPHPIDGSYRSGSAHGPDAKADLTYCQACHGQSGGPGSNPRFNVGIGGNGCETCHGANLAHPQDWAGPNNTFHYSAGNIQNACTLCHGVNLDGAGGVGPNCLNCHADAVSLTLDCVACHGSPPDGSADLDVPIPVPHGNAANISLHDTCVACHGMKETAAGGGFLAATNYTLFDKTTDTNGDHWNGNIEMNLSTQYNETNFGCDAAGCHGNDTAHQLSDSGLTVNLKDFGSGVTVPHPLDGTYISPSLHGPDAREDLTLCQACHAEAGGPGSNPRFNVGIGGNGCETCHGANLAHPQNWAGPNNTFHYQAGNVQNACTLCHGVNLDGVGGVGVACTSCHAETANFTLNCLACHGYPPIGSTEISDIPTPVDHRTVANISSHDTCTVCHGMKQTTSGGTFETTANYASFDRATSTNGDHWNGNIEMNSVPQYNETNFGCDAAGCHLNNPAHQLSDSGLTVNLKDFGGGGGTVPHATDGTFILPANHGPAAKALTAAFPNGMLDCQPCHAEAGGPGTNPRFNVGIASAGGNGCEGCHGVNLAHPATWYNTSTYNHSSTASFDMCTLCHGASYEGGSGPACTSCHNVDPVANSTGCVSCHNTPPDDNAPVGATRPNTRGRHFSGPHEGYPCSRCHDGAGAETANHYDTSAPANVSFSGGGTYNPSTSTCSNIGCHGSQTWY